MCNVLMSFSNINRAIFLFIFTAKKRFHPPPGFKVPQANQEPQPDPT